MPFPDSTVFWVEEKIQDVGQQTVYSSGFVHSELKLSELMLMELRTLPERLALHPFVILEDIRGFYSGSSTGGGEPFAEGKTNSLTKKY